MPVAPPDKCAVCGGSRLRKDGKVAVHKRIMGASGRGFSARFVTERCPGSNHYPNQAGMYGEADQLHGGTMEDAQ